MVIGYREVPFCPAFRLTGYGEWNVAYSLSPRPVVLLLVAFILVSSLRLVLSRLVGRLVFIRIVFFVPFSLRLIPSRLLFSWRSFIATRHLTKLSRLLQDTKGNTARARAFLFIISPDPLPPALHFLRTSNNPPPPGEGGAGGDDDRVAGGMMIAGGYVFLSRSLAIARSLFHIHCVGLGCAPFSSAHSFVVPSGEGGGDDGVVVLRFALRPVLRPVFSFRLYVHCSLFIVHLRRSKQGAAVFPVSPFVSCLAPSNPPSPLPVASFASLIRLVPLSLTPFVPSCVSSSVSFHAVSLCLSVLIPFRLARCAARLSSVLLPRRFVQLILSSSSHALTSSSPHDRIPQAGHGHRTTVS